MHSNNSWARGFMALFAIVLAMGLALAACPAEAAPFLYVANSGDSTVSVIDTATNTVVGFLIPVGNLPYGVAITPDGTKVYVTNLNDNNCFGDPHGHQNGGEDGFGGERAPMRSRSPRMGQRSTSRIFYPTMFRLSTGLATRWWPRSRWGIAPPASRSPRMGRRPTSRLPGPLTRFR